MSYDEVVELVGSIKFHDWRFKVHPQWWSPTMAAITVGFEAPDSDAAFKGDPDPQVGWTQFIMAVSLPYLTPERLLRDIWDRVRDALLHEAAEWFVARGERPFYPEHPQVIEGVSPYETALAKMKE